MSQFLNPLIVTPQSDGVHWALWEKFHYQSSLGGDIVIPQGFLTDFASTPRPIWNIFPPWGKYGRAAIVHDWLYWNQATTKDVADSVLREAMVVCGCDDVTITAIYKAVAIFGQDAWDNNAAEKRRGDSHIVDVNNITGLKLSRGGIVC